MTLKIQTVVNQDVIDKAKIEAYQILLNQQRYYAEQWNKNVRPKLRIFGLIISLIGIIISVSTIFYLKYQLTETKSLENTITEFIIYTALLTTLFFVFYFLPKAANKNSNWAIKFSEKTCKRIANTCVKNAKKQIPFIAEYEIEENSISYYRLKDETRQLIWTRKLEGVFIYSSTITLFFKKWASLSPTIIILHQHKDDVMQALINQNIESKPIYSQDE